MNPFPTKQAAFDHVVAFLRKQGVKSGSSGNCKYSLPQPDGPTLHCAAGCLAPGAAWVERTLVDSPTNAKIVAEACPFEGADLLVYDLQEAHDDYHPAYWEAQFAEVAARHGLTLLPLPA